MKDDKKNIAHKQYPNSRASFRKSSTSCFNSDKVSMMEIRNVVCVLHGYSREEVTASAYLIPVLSGFPSSFSSGCSALIVPIIRASILSSVIVFPTARAAIGRSPRVNSWCWSMWPFVIEKSAVILCPPSSIPLACFVASLASSTFSKYTQANPY